MLGEIITVDTQCNFYLLQQTIKRKLFQIWKNLWKRIGYKMMFPILGVIATLITLCSASETNDRPIIGVLALEYFGNLKYGSSYIAASYVKYLESAGARVVPIFVNQSLDYYSDVVNYTNGLLFPGGGAYFNRSDSGYGNAGKILYKLAIQANDRGDYYPVWGTCLGFELLTYLTTGQKWWLTDCKANDLALPLAFEAEATSSRLTYNMPSDVKNYLSTLPVTINYHTQCMTPKNFVKSGLHKFYQALTTNRDSKNVTFVSTIEALRYPIYGTAWHPEKNQFEFGLKKNRKSTPHTFQAVAVGQFFGNFFVNEARLNGHKFPSVEMEQNSLIYNFQPVYTSPTGSSFEQCYFFP